MAIDKETVDVTDGKKLTHEEFLKQKAIRNKEKQKAADRIPQRSPEKQAKKPKAKQYKPWFERLRDPRWQKKRLEIMELAEFKCQHCCDSESTLNVHHWFYDRGADPWDYEDHALCCLCETCHKMIEDLKRRLFDSIGHCGSDGGIEAMRYAIGHTLGWLCAGYGETVKINGRIELAGFMAGPLHKNYETLLADCNCDGIQVDGDYDWDEDGYTWFISSDGRRNYNVWCDEKRENRKRTNRSNEVQGHSDAGWWM